MDDADNTDDAREHFWLVTFSVAWDISVMVISLICNVYGLFYVSTNRHKYPSSSILVMSIAVSDIIVSTVVIPGNIVTHFLAVPVSPLLCKFCKYLSHWCTTIAGYCLAALCWDRFFVLSYNHDSFSKGRAMFYTSFVWFFGAAYNIWSVIIYTSWNMSEHQDLTYLRCVYNKEFQLLYDIVVICDLLVIYIFPLAISFAACLVIFRYWNRFPFTGPVIKGRKRRSKKMFFLPLFLMIIYATCHVPAKIFEIFLYVNSTKYLHLHEVYSLLEIICFLQGFLIIPTYILTTDMNDTAVVRRKMPSVGVLKNTDISSFIISELHTKLIPRTPTCSRM